MTTPHLDDEQLSALLDEEGAHAHVARCDACRGRLAQLTAARDAVAAPVPPLPSPVLDRMVAVALASAGGAADAAAAGAGDAADDAPATPIPLRSRRRLSAPPPAWLVGAAAAIAVLAGFAALLPRNGSDEGRRDDLAAKSAATESADTAAGAGATTASGEFAAALPDLGDLDDPEALVAILASADPVGGDAEDVAGNARTDDAISEPTTTTPPARREAATRQGAEPAAGGGSAAPAGPPVAASGHPGVLCRGEAYRIGAGRLGSHISTALVRWRGAPAEVLVFVLTEPANGVTRQALVLTRPGCVLLADPRF